MINFDGKLLQEDTNYFNANNRAFSHGDALVETVRVLPGKIVFWEDHYMRLMASMRILRMEIPMGFTMEYLQNEITRTIVANNMQEGTASAQFTIFRKTGVDSSTEANAVSFIIQTKQLQVPFYRINTTPYVVDLFKEHYMNSDMLSTISTTNKMLQTVGSIYAGENGFQDSLMLNSAKNVVQTLYGNLFLVKGELIKTPPLKDGCENGVLRKKIIEIIGKLNTYQFEEASISPFELQKADELFITNTIIGIQPITTYRKAAFKSDVANDLIGKLNALARLT
jgi:branched-chain amino acid aminotransferase